MAKLIDQRTGEERELLKPVSLIGRAEYCDICVPERTVSREHARIQRRLTGYYIEDLSSRHGTRLNGVRIHRRAKLRDGDVIAVPATRAEGQPTTGLRLPHTDTTELPGRGQPPVQEPPPSPDAPLAASFVFRR